MRSLSWCGRYAKPAAFAVGVAALWRQRGKGALVLCSSLGDWASRHLRPYEDQDIVEYAFQQAATKPAVELKGGPRAVLSSLVKAASGSTGLKDWASTARTEAILGACRLSIRSVSSGVRCLIAFCGRALSFALCDVSYSCRACAYRCDWNTK